MAAAHLVCLLEGELHRLGLAAGHRLDASCQTRPIARHPTGEARSAIRQRIHVKTEDAQFLHAGMDRRPVGRCLDGPDGHAELFRRWQRQQRRPSRLRLLRRLRADERLRSGRCGRSRCGVRRNRRRGLRRGNEYRRTADKGWRTPLRTSRISTAARRHGEAAQRGQKPQGNPAMRFLAHG